MKTASGSNRGSDAWQPHVFVAPRGIREHLWCLVLLAAPCGVLVIRGAWVVLLAAVIVLACLRPLLGVPLARIPARNLLFGGLFWLGVSMIAHTQTERALSQFALSASWWGYPPPDPSPWIGVAHLAFASAIAMLTLGIMLAYDRRAVDRAKVDARVWERQTTRRRQVLRTWSHDRDVPEVLP